MDEKGEKINWYVIYDWYYKIPRNISDHNFQLTISVLQFEVNRKEYVTSE